MDWKSFIIFLLLFLPGGMIAAQGKKYYLSSAGNDDYDGSGIATAWRTLDKINRTDFKPGDSLFMEGGTVFRGNIKLTSNDNGSAEKPVVFTSYGKGKAIVDAGDGEGILAINTSHLKLVSLQFKGSGVNSNKGSGIHFYSNDTSHAPSDITITHCDVSGFRTYGIGFGCHDNLTAKGYSNVRITHSNATENGEGGIGSYGSHMGYQHHDFYIAHCKAYRNRGILSKTQNHSGNGIVMGMVDGLLIEYCEAFENGADNRCSAGGPVGIWVWMCRNAVIQHCVSHHNYAGLTKDGGGFDIDGGASDCILQYNYSYNNEGAGYLLAEYGAIFPFTNNTVRFNVSVNDGRKNNYGGISLWGAAKEFSVTNAYVYNNTILTNDKNIIDGNPAGITLMGPHFKNVVIANNIFVTKGNVNIINADEAVDTSAVLLLHNNYYSYSGQYFIQWQHQRFTSLRSWFNQNPAQEKRQGRSLWINKDPMFKNQEIFTGKTAHNAGEYFRYGRLKVLPGSSLRQHLFPVGDHFNILSNTKDYCDRDIPTGEKVMPGACTQ